MKISEMYPSKYAKGEDLKGREVTLTISRVSTERMRPSPNKPEEDKFVIYFQETQKGVILSMTLAKQIAQAIGSEETNQWPGRRVTIYPENINVAGVQRIAIRAKAAPKTAPADTMPRIER